MMNRIQTSVSRAIASAVILSCIGCTQEIADKTRTNLESLCRGKGLGKYDINAARSLNQANQLALEDRHEDAIDKLSDAIESDPTFGCAYYNRAQSYLAIGNLKEAVTDYTSSLNIQPKLADAHIGRGLAYLRDGRLSEAIKDNTDAISIDSSQGYAWSNRAAAREKKKEYKAAIKDYSKALEILPNTPSILIRRGITYSSIGDISSGCKDLRKALELESNPAKKVTLEETIDSLCDLASK